MNQCISSYVSACERHILLRPGCTTLYRLRCFVRFKGTVRYQYQLEKRSSSGTEFLASSYKGLKRLLDRVGQYDDCRKGERRDQREPGSSCGRGFHSYSRNNRSYQGVESDPAYMPMDCTLTCFEQTAAAQSKRVALISVILPWFTTLPICRDVLYS